MQAYQFAILLGIVLAIAELMTLSFLFLGMAVAAWVVAALQFVMGDFSFNRDVAVFAVASVVFFVVFRKLFKRQTDAQAFESQDINHY
jgi:membrane protein implicated in regulation of membrane protease activity